MPSVPDAAFEAAHEDAQRLATAPSEGVALQLYAYYQQATAGDNTTDPPAEDDRAGWNVWTGMKGMSRQEAQSEYIALVENLKRLDRR